MGLWLWTRQLVSMPHAVMHGLMHFCRSQLLSTAHSELKTHSGRQFGGGPMKFSMQVQTAWLFMSRHKLLGPHGDGLQGILTCTSGSSYKAESFIMGRFEIFFTEMEDYKSYFAYVADDIMSMDRRWNLRCTCTKANDFAQNIRHFVHNYLDMDSGIYSGRSSDSMRNHYLLCIRAGNLCKDLRSIRASIDKSRSHYFQSISHLNHMD